MTSAEILNRHREVLERLRRWRKNPTLTRSLACRLSGVSRQRFSELLRVGLVARQFLDGEELISLASLETYYSTTVSKRLKEGKLRKPVLRQLGLGSIVSPTMAALKK
jgi:hypothetical protein